MEMNLILPGIMGTMGLNFFYLYSRKKPWLTNRLRWHITGGFGFIGLWGCILAPEIASLYWYLITPLIFTIADRLFRYISQQTYDRDFYLWLRGSHEIDDSFFGKNPHVRPMDQVFSIGLLLILVLLPILGNLL